VIRYASVCVDIRRLVGVRLEGLRRGVGGMWLAMARYGTVRGLVGCRAPSEVGERPAVPVEMRSGLVRRALLPPYGCLPLFQAGIYSLLAVSAANRAGGSPRSGTPSRNIAPCRAMSRLGRIAICPAMARNGSLWHGAPAAGYATFCELVRYGSFRGVSLWFTLSRVPGGPGGYSSGYCVAGPGSCRGTASRPVGIDRRGPARPPASRPCE